MWGKLCGKPPPQQSKYVYKCKYCTTTIEYDSYQGLEVQDEILCYLVPCGCMFFLLPQILSCGLIKPCGCYWRCFKCKKCGLENEKADDGDCSHFCHRCHDTSLRHPVNCYCVPGHSYLWKLTSDFSVTRARIQLLVSGYFRAGSAQLSRNLSENAAMICFDYVGEAVTQRNLTKESQPLLS